MTDPGKKWIFPTIDINILVTVENDLSGEVEVNAIPVFMSWIPQGSAVAVFRPEFIKLEEEAVIITGRA